MAKLPEFAKRIRIRARYVTKNSDQLVRDVTKAVVEELVWGTPVLTGRARSNWRTLLYPSDNILFWPPSDVPGEGKPVTPEEGAQRALEEAQETISAYTGGRRSIRIVNNVPYIVELNKGSSTQAPPLFVEMAVAAGKEKIAKAKPVSADVEH